MNIRPTMKTGARVQTGVVVVLSALLLSACASRPTPPSGAEQVRARLNALQQDSALALNARVELRNAEEAVLAAERPLPEEELSLGAHRVYMADKMVSIAIAKAQTRLAETERERLDEQRSAARLAARTLEADRAGMAAERANMEAEELQRQIESLQAEATDRGLVLTLGDVLFATGSAEIEGGSNQNLEKLAAFLNEYPARQVLIEGHTDNVGNATFNQTLSRQRAESVRQYLISRGIAASRLSVSGFGLERPVASNETVTGRQQNRRVEVIIQNKE